MVKIYQNIVEKKQAKQKSIAVLIDPDNLNPLILKDLVKLGIENAVDYFFVGGSLITNDSLNSTLTYIKSHTQIPCIIFPGSVYQINPKADALLFLSLISGRNADLLIGQHVIAAPLVKQSGIEVLPTGYILVDSGVPTTASYISHSLPVPYNKPSIAAVTAMAGEMLGLKLFFLDAGSGAKNPVSGAMIQATSAVIDCPLIVGGGIKTAEKVAENYKAGADLLVIGNSLEENPDLITELSKVRFNY